MFGETRTRILLLYAATMLVVTAVSVPIFRALLFANVGDRVRADLVQERDEFVANYRQWEQLPNQTVDDLKDFLNEYLTSEHPEDDNFHVAILRGEFYRANPVILPDVLSPQSEVFQTWLALNQPIIKEYSTSDANTGSILYIATPLRVEGQQLGTLIMAHITAGERNEALASVFVFVKVTLGVVLISFLLAWFATRQLLAPVRTLASTARSISESNLNQRLDVQGSGELAELSATFNSMMYRLQTSFNSQRNFVNDAGHELRTPITIIRGHLELMGDDPHEKEETLELVLDELDRMARFVNDMIMLSKSERPDFLQLETIDLHALTEELYSKATALASRNWTLGAVGRGCLVGDRQRITGAIINLAQNATQHTQPHDQIELGSAVTGKDVYIWVRDTGDGIAPADQARIFERFARAANSYRRSEGAGLGLSIVRAIAEAHSGRVELSSQLGVGSTFTLVLPLEPPREVKSA